MTVEDSLAAEFRRYFEILHADTPALKSQAFQLRYQVYCLESKIPGFEAFCYPNGEETDEYDEHAFHVLLIHRPTGSIAGTVRLVLPDTADPLWVFPIEAHAGPISKYFNPEPIRDRIVEVSRFIVAPQFRRRLHEREHPDGVTFESDVIPNARRDRRHSPHPALGLVKACLDYCWANKYSFWYAAMEPRLVRFLEVYGIAPQEIASSISYFGTVNAYFKHFGEMIEECAVVCPEVWRFFTDNGKSWPLMNKSQFTSPLTVRQNQKADNTANSESVRRKPSKDY